MVGSRSGTGKESGFRLAVDREFGPVLSEMAEVSSRSAVLRLIWFLGGSRVVFPENPRPDHRLAILLGQDHFVRVCDRFGRVPIDLPKGALFRRRRRMAMMRGLVRGLGWSERAVARAFGVSRQFVNAVNQPRNDWVGVAAIECVRWGSDDGADDGAQDRADDGADNEWVQGFTPTAAGGLRVGSGGVVLVVADAWVDGMGFFGKAGRVLSGLRRLEGLVQAAKLDDGRIDREEFREIAVFGLMPILVELGVDVFQGFLPESPAGKAAFKQVVEAIEGEVQDLNPLKGDRLGARW